MEKRSQHRFYQNGRDPGKIVSYITGETQVTLKKLS